jgi:hypothetical protein
MKLCDKTCIFCFFPIIIKYLCMAKRSLFPERPSYMSENTQISLYHLIHSSSLMHTQRYQLRITLRS